MYGYVPHFVTFSAMICFTTSYGDLFNRPTPRSADPIYPTSFQQNADFTPTDRREIGRGQQHRQIGPYTRDISSFIGPVRHTITSTKVDIPAQGNLRNPPTTVKSYVVKDSPNVNKNVFNASSTPDLANRSSGKRKSQAYEDESDMLYPSDEDHADDVTASQIRSKNCSYGFCDEVDDYPTDKIYRILSRSKDLRIFFSEDVTVPPAIDSRFGTGEAGEPLCMSMSHTRFPKTAVNMKNVEQLLINVDNFKQGVVYETCVSDGGACNYSQDFPQNYVSHCTQKYTVRKLMVVGKESDNPIFDDFKIPSCCVCTVSKVTDGKT